LACGEVGLTIDYFYSLTPRQFDNVLAGYRNKEEAREKANWERARYQMYYSLISMQGADKIKLQDVMQFPWEQNQTAALEEQKPKTQKELKEFWDNVDKNKE
tara:strand:+ start:6150 stop:6455 length:306 start_codon:yes stop_codon:yes gene_type:complete